MKNYINGIYLIMLPEFSFSCGGFKENIGLGGQT